MFPGARAKFGLPGRRAIKLAERRREAAISMRIRKDRIAFLSINECVRAERASASAGDGVLIEFPSVVTPDRGKISLFGTSG